MENESYTSPSVMPGSGIIGEARNLLGALSGHLLVLLKLGQTEAAEAQKKIVRKVVFFLLAGIFFLVAYLFLNVAGAFFLNEILGGWKWAFLAITGINLLIAVLLAVLAMMSSITPLFKDTTHELETDLLWITEKYKTKRNSDNS